jgi:hypothetical protein
MVATNGITKLGGKPLSVFLAGVNWRNLRDFVAPGSEVRLPRRERLLGEVSLATFLARVNWRNESTTQPMFDDDAVESAEYAFAVENVLTEFNWD